MGKRSRPRRQAATTEQNGRLPGRWRPVILVAILAAAAISVYLGALHNPFVYDDNPTVVSNPTISNLADLRGIMLYSVFRPLANLSYAVDFALGGAAPFGFHLTSILLHALNVALLFLLGRQLAGDSGADQDDTARDLMGFAAAGLYAVHPLLTEAVGYVAGRAEVLCATFFLVAFLALRSFLVAGRGRDLGIGLAAFILALAAKETAAMLPFVLLAWDFFLGGRDRGRWRRRLRLHLPLLAAVVLAAAARVFVYLTVEHASSVENPWLNLQVEAVVVWRYVGLLLLPIGQSMMHEVRRITSALDPTAVLAILGLGAVAFGVVKLRHRLPLVSFGMTSFGLLLLPSHVVPLAEAMAEHRVYAAALGFFLAIAGLLAELDRRLGSGRRRYVAGGLLALLAVLGGLTVARLKVWSDPIRLWTDVAQRAPHTWAAQYGLADALRLAGRPAEAIPPYQRAIQILPEELDAYLNLGICLAQTDRTAQAREAFQAASRIAPGSPKPYNNLGMLAMLEGQPAQAREHLNEALSRDARNVRARQLLAQLYETAFRDPARAATLCEEIRAIAPGTPGVDECIRRNRVAAGGAR